MTQIVDKNLYKMCSKCQSMFDKPCAWLSLGNEYCDEIMNIQQQINQLTNNWNELEEWLLNHYEVKNKIQNKCIDEVLDKMKETKGEDNE